jgi:citrate synthase
VLATKIADVTSAIWEEGKTLFPNPSAYTAAVALHIELPSEFTPYLFVAARLSAWTGILLSS